MDLGETIGQRIVRELREKLGTSKVKPCGCCGVKTGPRRRDAPLRPCGCTILLCQEPGCYKCLKHCPHRKPKPAVFECPEDVIEKLKEGNTR